MFAKAAATLDASEVNIDARTTTTTRELFEIAHGRSVSGSDGQ